MTGLLFRSAAAADLEEAASWYEMQRPGLGQAFLAAAESAVRQVLAQPQSHGAIYKDRRRVPLGRFPYLPGLTDRRRGRGGRRGAREKEPDGLAEAAVTSVGVRGAGRGEPAAALRMRRPTLHRWCHPVRHKARFLPLPAEVRPEMIFC